MIQNIHSLPDRLLFRLRHTIISAHLRTQWLRICGAKIGKRTLVPNVFVTWPNQVKIGNHCILEPDIFFKFDGIWSPGPSILIDDGVFIGRGCEFNIRKRISVGQGSAIASGCKFIDHEHDISGARIDEAEGLEREIIIGKNVLIGVNSIVLIGVSIGDSSVIGAGSVVTKSVPAFEIWAGVPARRLGIKKH